MNFYPHHIKDFNNATRHLTRVERSVYRDAIEHYYDTELALTSDIKRLEKLLLCTTEEEKNALNLILEEFFEATEEGFYNERCNEEITKYRANASAKAKAGIASAEARRRKRTERQQNLTERQQNLTDEQQTKNQEPLTNKDIKESKPKKKKIFILPDWVNKAAWNEFEKHRRDIRKPLTELAKTKAANCLNGFSPEEQQAAIDQTIQNRWTGIFPKKLNGANYETDKNRQNTGNNGSGSGSGPGREEVDFNSMDW
jgi:uncharacterized protein YdaU (DUF1376 family)